MSSQDSEKFLPHLYDPLRREIAIRYAKHELRKLLPSVRDINVWNTIDKDVDDWYEKLSMRNFWNGIHGISMGFRLKSLVPLITSFHTQWEEKEITVDEIWFSGGFGLLNSLKIYSEQASSVRESVFDPENVEFLEKTKKILLERQNESAPRDHFPLFVVRKDGKLRVIDGNRRLLQAIVDKRENINVVIGETNAEPMFYEHWVPTSILVELVFWHKRQFKKVEGITDSTSHVIAELIRHSSAGRIEFVERSVSTFDDAGKALFETVAKILSKDGIILEIKK